MTAEQVVVRETAISVVINTAIGIGRFLLLFGLGEPVRVAGSAGAAWTSFHRRSSSR